MRVKHSHVVVMLAALAVLAVRPARADYHAWSFSALGGYGQYSNRTFYPVPAESLADAPLFGARLSRSLGQTWVLEAAGAYASTHSLLRNGSDGADVTAYNVSGSLLANLTNDDRWGSFYLLAGGGYTQYKADGTDDLHYGTFEAGAGWKIPISSAVALRLEARNLLNVPKDDWSTATQADQQYWGGLTFGWGGKPKDTDADGVPDKKDKCPDTPKGASVNATGCPTDSDGDGVWDGLDQCLGTPKGASVDAKGCPTDTDGDGVYDGLDQCADTPKGATVDAKGCPSDTDGDGVMDGLDQCPSTPKGATVDAKGCPMDSDGDGVPDGLDGCPNTPAGLKVDASGCPIEVTEKETEMLDTGMIRLQNVNFETGKSALLPESYAALDEVGGILLKWPQLQIEIGGHTDSRGRAVKNQMLSEERAQAVKDYLVDKFPGLAAAQLSVKGYGANRPLVPNTSALNMSKNRRVEFKVMNRDALKKEVERRKMLKK